MAETTPTHTATDPLERLRSLGVELPAAPGAVASYVPVRLDGGLAYVSGQLPLEGGRLALSGLVGVDVSVEQAAHAARRCAINALAALREHAGGLGNVAGVVRVRVFVACGSNFTEHPAVGNGASELLQQVFGEGGRHARAAVGCSSLPLGAPVEVELVARLRHT